MEFCLKCVNPLDNTSKESEKENLEALTSVVTHHKYKLMDFQKFDFLKLSNAFLPLYPWQVNF
jgi:hypothetical protein